jgi:hypothetical protein
MECRGAVREIRKQMLQIFEAGAKKGVPGARGRIIRVFRAVRYSPLFPIILHILVFLSFPMGKIKLIRRYAHNPEIAVCRDFSLSTLDG